VSGLAPFAILYAVIILIQGFSVITFIRNAGSLEMSISYDIRQDAFTRLQELSFSFYDRTAVGYIMARMVSDIARLSEMIAWSLVDILWSLLFALGCIVTMFALSWKLALIALAVLPPLAYVSMKLQNSCSSTSGKRASRTPVSPARSTKALWARLRQRRLYVSSRMPTSSAG
jgi:ATP-binding cassette subfamily B protein